MPARCKVSILPAEGGEILLLIPDLHGIDVSSTYLINEIDRHINSRGGTMAAIIAADSEGVDMWRDLSMASYPIYTSEDNIDKGNRPWQYCCSLS